MLPLAAMFAAPTAASSIEAIGAAIDKLFTSEEEKMDKKALLQKLALSPHIAQIEINKLEAQHRSVFVAGWRPAVGWVCVAALAYNFIVRDLSIWILTAFDSGFTPPETATENLIAVLLALLGLGGMRSVEKLAGRAR